MARPRPQHPKVEVTLQPTISGINSSGHPFLICTKAARLIGAPEDLDAALPHIIAVLKRHNITVESDVPLPNLANAEDEAGG